MTDAHCHLSGGDESVREFLIGRDFFGVHPWEAEAEVSRFGSLEAWKTSLRTSKLSFGVGEIGLDRLREKNIPSVMREVFEAQLELAFELNRPVVLHGAKCWGEVVKEVARQTAKFANLQTFKLPPLLFHGFSRSEGLIPEIVRLNGFISVGPAVLNDHAVNYRELVKKIPLKCLLIETDRTIENAAGCPSIREVLGKTAELRGLSADELEKITDFNADAFFPAARR